MRLALGIEYDGASYHGWQRQQSVASVQQHVEEALSEIANAPIKVVCAGRTDAGVHATCQVVHFDTDCQRPDRAWSIGLNRFLPDSIAVKWVSRVDEEFHARFSATARRYRYVIYNNRLRNSILAKGVTHVHVDLDHELMHQAAQHLVGRHDFSAFRAVNCQANTPVRDLQKISVTRFSDYIVIDVQANAFLHHMVRNITGSLLVIGNKVQKPEWMKALLQGKDRTKAAATAKPHGLYLVHVTYPEQFELPKNPLGPLFLPN
ncbi:tRNA pseudouridine(38-40) synthase TruA [Paraglaciecola sp. L3A3]|uniref:tRNA pseudouridine(38-40) synthase TruA n=1 Tax=Paraglaciecola sp. L3A3 TaxID=2686358 RepID=UPI00131AB7A7|nr:tRNA pseudouridine(38-40) synthase TruA [Paraglaciecola sp. L3A3]